MQFEYELNPKSYDINNDEQVYWLIFHFQFQFPLNSIPSKVSVSPRCLPLLFIVCRRVCCTMSSVKRKRYWWWKWCSAQCTWLNLIVDGHGKLVVITMMIIICHDIDCWSYYPSSRNTLNIWSPSIYSLHSLRVARRVHSLCVLFAKFDIDLNFVTIFTLFPFCCSPGVTPTEAFIWSVSHLSTLLSLQLHLHSASDVTHSWMQLHIMWKCNALWCWREVRMEQQLNLCPL